MTNLADLSSPCGPMSGRPARARTLLARLLATRHGRHEALAPERWSRHMLRDIGLADHESSESPRSIVTTATGWPIR